jgi:hypothetical protein
VYFQDNKALIMSRSSINVFIVQYVQYFPDTTLLINESRLNVFIVQCFPATVVLIEVLFIMSFIFPC